MRNPQFRAACLLLLQYCATTCICVAAQNGSEVSQIYESVHLTEATKKVRDGDSKLEDLLHWAIENSDPEQLKQQAEVVGRDNVDLSDRQKEVQQVKYEAFCRKHCSSVTGVLSAHMLFLYFGLTSADDPRYAVCTNRT